MEIQPVQIQTPDLVGAYARGLQTRHAMQQMQDEDRTRAAQEALRALFSRPGFDASKPEGIQQVMGIDPTTGMQMQKTQLANQQAQSEINSARLKAVQQAAKGAYAEWSQLSDDQKNNPDVKRRLMEGHLQIVGQPVPTWDQPIDTHWNHMVGMATADLVEKQAQAAYQARLDYKNAAGLKGLPSYGDTHPQPQVDLQSGQGYFPGAGGAPGVVQPLPGGTNFRQQQQNQERAERYRTHFEALPEVKDYKNSIVAYRSAVDAAGRDTRAADLDMVYAFAKMMDPGSVVRESEGKMILETAAPDDRIQGWWNSIIGGGKLTADVRKNLLDEMQSRMNSFKSAYDNQRTQYDMFARDAGMDPIKVYADPLSMGEPFKPKAGGATIPKWNPPSVPQEGDKRRGRNRAGVPIEQIYRNGQWVNL